MIRPLMRALLFLLCLLALPAAGRAEPATYALVLHGGDAPSPWTDSVAAGMRGEADDGVRVEQVHLGGPAMDEDDADRAARHLAQRLDKPVRMVVATDGTGAAFAAKYRDELFPETAVVLAWPGRIDPLRLELCGDCAPLPLERDLDGTLELIFSLRPETGLVVGVADSSPDGQAAVEALKRAMQRSDNKAELLFPGHEPGDEQGLDLPALKQLLAGLPGRSVGVLLRFAEDNRGRPVAEGELARMIGERAAAPVFVLSEGLLGFGAAGGSLVTGRDAGRFAVRTANRILDGEPAREMLPEPVPARVVLDGQALARFGMVAPDGAEVVNAPDAPSVPDGLAQGVAPLALTGLAAFGLLFFLFRHYRQ